MRKKLKVILLTTALLCASAASSASSGGDARAHSAARAVQRTASRQRIRPPDSLTCDRNRLTSFTGAVTSYSRGPRLVSLRMRTDEATNERFSLRLGRGDDAAGHFLLNGEPFTGDDWKKIETRRGKLRPRMRATVWVCSDEPAPTIDWRPGERPAGVFD